MAELINTLTALACLFSRYTQGKEAEMPNFIRTSILMAVHAILLYLFYLYCFILLCGIYHYDIFMFCPKEKTQQMKKLFTDVNSLHVKA